MLFIEFVLEFFVEVVLRGVGYLLGKILGYTGASIFWLLGGCVKPISAYLELDDYGFLSYFIGLLVIVGLILGIYLLLHRALIT